MKEIEQLEAKGSSFECRTKFSGIVVTHNEATRLPACLNSLSFCDEIVVMDLGSKDESVEIAKIHGARVLYHPHVSVVEEVRVNSLVHARNEWIVFADPDEFFPEALTRAVVRILDEQTDTAAVMVPYRYYFREKPIYRTRWGGQKYITRFVKKNEVILSGLVHRGIQVPSNRVAKVPFREDLAVRHYWVDSYAQLFEKHWRYIQSEGRARYETGERFSWNAAISSMARSLKTCLIDDQGIRGGFTGIFLSLFWGWYVAMSWLSLRRYQRNRDECQW